MDEETEDRELSNMPKFPWLARGRARIELQIFQIKLLGGRLLKENREISTSKNRWGPKGLSGKMRGMWVYDTHSWKNGKSMECGWKTKTENDDKRATCIVRAELASENGSLEANVGVGKVERLKNQVKWKQRAVDLKEKQGMLSINSKQNEASS